MEEIKKGLETKKALYILLMLGVFGLVAGSTEKAAYSQPLVIQGGDPD